MVNKIIAIVGVFLLLASCETASQKAVSGSASSAGASKAVKKAAKTKSVVFLAKELKLLRKN